MGPHVSKLFTDLTPDDQDMRRTVGTVPERLVLLYKEFPETAIAMHKEQGEKGRDTQEEVHLSITADPPPTALWVNPMARLFQTTGPSELGYNTLRISKPLVCSLRCIPRKLVQGPRV